VAGNLFGIYLSQGEVCSASSRLVVQRPVYDEFCQRFAERAQEIRVGIPARWETQMGAIISSEALQRMLRYLDPDKTGGARLLAGGERPSDPELKDGNFLRPTVFADVDNSSPIAQEEIFGPIVVIIPFDSEEEGVRLANQTEYGLAAGIWTRDLNRAHRVAAQLQAGCLWVNQWGSYPSEAPFGGYKQSGTGHDLGIESLHEYMQVKNVHIDLAEQGQDWYGG
jgi:acyl-CoA reductase-like NAD-dependent aldehyde dehydrogenase